MRLSGARIAKIGVLLRLRIGQQKVGAKGFLVEENARSEAERGIELLVSHSRIGSHVDAEIVDHAFRDRAIGTRALDRISATIAQNRAPIDGELIALGVAAEVVQDVEDQNSRARPRGFAVEIGGAQTAEASAHDHQIVVFTGIGRFVRFVPKRVVAKRVSRRKRSRMRTAHSHE